MGSRTWVTRTEALGLPQGAAEVGAPVETEDPSDLDRVDLSPRWALAPAVEATCTGRAPTRQPTPIPLLRQIRYDEPLSASACLSLVACDRDPARPRRWARPASLSVPSDREPCRVSTDHVKLRTTSIFAAGRRCFEARELELFFKSAPECWTALRSTGLWMSHTGR